MIKAPKSIIESVIKRPSANTLRAVIAFSLCASVIGSGLAFANTTGFERSDSVIRVSFKPDRSDSRPLTGTLLSGNAYIFVADGGYNSVAFYVRKENVPENIITSAKANPPFDLAYTNRDGTAKPYDTTQLKNGYNSLRVVVRDAKTGEYSNHYSVFGVQNKVTPPVTVQPPVTTPPSTHPPVTVPPSTVPPTTQPPIVNNWKLTFSDEFNGASVDTTKWNVYDENKSGYNSVESPKASTCPKESNVSVSGGILKMKVQKSNGTCNGGQAQSGAGMNTFGKFDQSMGRWEARVRWSEKGNYLWGGFWTAGNYNKAMPNGQTYSKEKASEIDIFEYIGKGSEPFMSRFKPALHTDYTAKDTMRNFVVSPIDVTAWHTYAVEWEQLDPTDPMSMTITAFLDGKAVGFFDKQGTWAINANGTKSLVSNKQWNAHRAGDPDLAFPNPFNAGRKHLIILSAWAGAPQTDATTVANGFNPSLKADGTRHASVEFDFVRVYSR